jgi:glycosyltransferase involved in cell wall biosynthesis
MNLKSLVTVYIPCRNYGKFLSKSIDSVLSQLYINWELFIIDEGSTDDSVKIASEYLNKYPKKIKLIKNEKPIGLQKIANNILGISNGKYMVRLDADDWFDESALILMVSKLEKTPKAGLVYGNYYYTDKEGKILGIENRHILVEEDDSGQLPPHGACTMFRTRSLKSSGGYSESVNAQDGWDLWFKLSKKIGVVNLRAPLFYYRQHGNSMSRDENRLLKARGKIFDNIANKLEGSYSPKVLAVIPVRESYPNFEGVPYKKINGESILEIAINNAYKSKKVGSVMVYSESNKVLEFSKRLETEGKVPKHIRLKRNKLKKSSKIPIKDFMLSAANYYSKLYNSYPDILIFLSLHAINRRSNHIDEAISVLRINESDSVVSVQEEREPMFKHGVDGLELINPGRFQNLIFDKERLYRFNGSLIATWFEILETENLFGNKISYLEMSAEDSKQLKSNSDFNDLIN